MKFYVNGESGIKIDTHVILCNGETEGKLSGTASELYTYIKSEKGFSCSYKQTETFDLAGTKDAGKYIFTGFEGYENKEHDSLRKIFSDIAYKAADLKAVNLSVDLDETEGMNPEELNLYIMAVAEGFALSLYRFDKYLTKKKQTTVESLNINVPAESVQAVKATLEEAGILIEMTCAARNLTNEPSNNQTPQLLGEQAKALCDEVGIECCIYDDKQMAEWGLKAALAVGQGSPNAPRLIVMRYKGNPDSDEIVGLVGKGITFDSGGLSLKGKQRLPHMKHDMAGSAAVIGAINAIAKRKLPINVTAVVAACENLLSGNGYKPGDIIGSMAGKSILIISTDAEGRLTLADAITYAVKKENINCVFDIATLTGGARAIFGGYINPFMSNDDELSEVLLKATAYTGVRVQRMPIMPEARALLNTHEADIKNSSPTPYLRMQQGAMFVNEFVGDFPWVHIDMSGSGIADFDINYTPIGGTGRGVRNLYHSVRLIAENK